ncbi:MAG: hypothetical protein EWV92_20985 [Microcystis aeruginosa Ma_MB_S_20031200_S102]|uniref:Uncharacterized protein n=1 Tax=Microcystis aeruginosa Ma_MB_S_20031200_S102 TaxID=2486254 RepID=A0A552E9J8_MICAE|nr:MAG: hypothetical protein EWV67_19240 [Microcystis sp. M_QC_C_20170808_M2Col]TRT66047.1 MAG: hypothetical protein EWV68_15920 [Microcystis sp. M_QC_C_20170808_M9Col]TRU18431.1 MAG: hypothetical protein EWV79_22635 [Microcystis aeruginosa Ma_MB_S_20031200_S102D]TRU31179.1 MAG: hypothetical protein EWV92_20985 [Microcystis aeruginosa Ma_MB_S_20031200_S102]
MTVSRYVLKIIRHPPYQGGQGGSNLKFIFNLIITSYLSSRGKLNFVSFVSLWFTKTKKA